MSSADFGLSVDTEDIESAENKLKSALKFSPDDCTVISNCGNFYFNNAKYDKALDYFLRALSIDNKDAETYYKIAKCYIEKNLFNEAVSYLEKAVFFDDEEPEYLSELARLYYKKNNIEKAAKAFEQLITLTPNDAWAYSNLGNIYLYHLDDLEKAHECYQRAVEIDFDYAWGLYNFACVKVLFNNFEEAIELYERACSISPENELFKLALAHTYYRAGNTDKTIELFDGILNHNANNPEVLFCLGKIYLCDKKNNIEAKKYFERSMLLDEDNPEVYYYLAKISFLDFDKKNAMINISHAIELDDDNDKFKALKNMINEME
ncbi:MAG: tetratricopeptide repeat protein [bacterium]|nr:tetratricopeptide repeat protein [bacterium]